MLTLDGHHRSCSTLRAKVLRVSIVGRLASEGCICAASESKGWQLQRSVYNVVGASLISAGLCSRRSQRAKGAGARARCRAESQCCRPHSGGGASEGATACDSATLTDVGIGAPKLEPCISDVAVGRRQLLPSGFACGCFALPPQCSGEETRRSRLVEVTDPQTYSALAYAPPGASGKLPLIVVLHGAGSNELDVWNLANPQGEHAGLPPSLLTSGTAPTELADNFAVVAPYSAGKRSFYEEPRGRMLRFVDWVCSEAGRQAGCPNVDPTRIFLLGFSDGATVGVELATTRRFAGGVFAAYGFTGDLPALAAERLKDLPIWVFHSADDVIFRVSCSDKLVKTLRTVNSRDVVRYTRYDRDQEGFTGAVRGHSTGITASRQPDIYSWMLSI
mmetsp:Transcript_25677/g.85705  ORF Transcript_25677/g.85705 Transcript_25677/m.85705 type:complete len:390 (-) Transcript_25677:272-1441(-)